MIPVIERSGGKVLVNATVKDIVTDVETNKVLGVNVTKGSEKCLVKCPVVVSDAGVLNTFTRLLSPSTAKSSYFTNMINQSDVKAGMGMMSVFVGLNKSGEELKLKAQVWSLTQIHLSAPTT